MNYSFFIGIDISKEWFDVYVKGKLAVKGFQRFDNNTSGFKQFIKWLKQELQLDLSSVFVCLEHTGVYAVPICEFLGQKKLAYTLIPGVLIAKQAMNRGKNDRLDAKRIAMYAYKNREDIRIHQLPVQAIRKLKVLLSFRDRTIKAKHIFQVSSKEVGAFETKAVSSFMVENSQHMIEQCTLQIKQIERQIKELLKAHPQINKTYELLLSIPGIGPQNALHMICATKNFVSFNCPKKFAAFAGIAPFGHQSGKSVRNKSKVSHKANKKIKTLLSNAVVCSLNSCSEYRLYFERQLKKGKDPNSIKNVLKNKIVARAFAVIKRDSAYVDTHAFAS